jgi:hypothetical protein
MPTELTSILNRNKTQYGPSGKRVPLYSKQNESYKDKKTESSIRMNSASQYVVDDLPEGIEQSIEKFITQ